MLVAFFSASQDIVIDAYRVEILDRAQQPTGAAVTQYGYRIGMLMSGRGRAVPVRDHGLVRWVYAVMAGCIALGLARVPGQPRAHRRVGAAGPPPWSGAQPARRP
ncbi:MAG: hypothetical protein WDO24_26745 [Pseudomonadota bacterium]